MTRMLKTSGFLGLAVMMCIGVYQFTLLSGGSGVPGWMVGGHAHLGVLSILAIVTGFTVDAFELASRLRAAVSGLYVVGQWGLPLTIFAGEGAGLSMLMPTSFIWAACLIVSMLLMAWQAASAEDVPAERARPATPADD